ncbi:MAG: PilZ domain-containing protein [Candidatus Omnitrophica bacterium]|nr:PilZ domain-containing protein [Candidatus Omnitrophota bacterium]
MDKSKPVHERRKTTRLAGNIPLKIYSDDFDLVTETKNLSRSGVYCRVNKYIEPMTRLKIHLLLPLKKTGKIVTKKISCGGVVVRAESIPGEDSFNIAIYFNDILMRDAESLAGYVSDSLDKEA